MLETIFQCDLCGYWTGPDEVIGLRPKRKGVYDGYCFQLSKEPVENEGKHICKYCYVELNKTPKEQT